MKKTIVILFSILITVALVSFKAIETLKVEGSIQEWQNVVNVMDQSNARHLEVEAAKKFIITQLNQQLDTTKKK